MKTDGRRTAALAMLQAAGIRRSNYAPPIVRLFWYLGIDVPPPHFASFLGVAAAAGIFFGSAWGICMWFAAWSPQGLPVPAAVVVAAVTGLMFGLAIAAYYRYSARKHGMPRWDELDRHSDGP